MEDAGESASQLLLFSIGFSVIISVFVLTCSERLLGLLLGRVETDVMAACVTYLRISAYAGVAMGPAFITVIGQCMGNGNTDAADFYFRKLTRITLFLSSAWNLLIFLLTPLFLMAYALEPETKRLVIWLVLIHNVFNLSGSNSPQLCCVTNFFK